MYHSKVVRYILKDMLQYLPKGAKVLRGGSVRLRKDNRVMVELDYYWMRKNGKKYARLVGEL